MNANAPQTPACGCGSAAFPQATLNASALDAIVYRIGDFLAFRDSLLRPLASESALTGWHPKADGDLALQMVDWWAYIADVLTFYNERIANEDYLRTAQWPESVAHLVQTLGYRPKPALGAKGAVAGLLSPGTRPPIVVPQGLQIQSKSGPGKTPQVFEVDAATNIGAPDVVIADVVPDKAPLFSVDAAGNKTLWLAGKVGGIKVGDRYLLVSATAISAQVIEDYAWIGVTGVASGTNPPGGTVTKLSIAVLGGSIDASKAKAANYVLLKGQQSSTLWSYSPSPPVLISAGPTPSLELGRLAVGVGVGSLVLIDVADGVAAPTAANATAIAQQLMSAAKAVLSSPTSIPALQDLQAAGGAAFKPKIGELAGIAINFLNIGVPGAGGPIAVQAATLGLAEASALLDEATVLAAGAKADPLGAAVDAGLVATSVIVTSYAEAVWYANGNGRTPPGGNPAPPGVAIPHSVIGWSQGVLQRDWWPFAASQVSLRWGWTPVGQLAPVQTAANYVYPNGGSGLTASPVGGAFKATSNAVAVLLEDPNGVAAAAGLTAAGDPAIATPASLAPPPPLGLASPIETFFNLIPLSRGKTVASEVMGSGDTRIAGQDFTLVKSPVTYFSDPASVSGDSFSSTVKVIVNGVQWQEERNFFGQGPTAQVFVLREDDQGQTHVTFGDGVNGARLPTGVGNVVATYRFGASGDAPAAETLTTVLTPIPGLKGVRNPLPPTGGTDMDSPAHIRALAPASVLTLGRCVSLDDYAVTAAGAGGVTQAAASFDVDPVSQRPMTTLYVAGDDGVVASASAALAGAGASIAKVRVLKATPVTAKLRVAYLRDLRYGDADVLQRLTSALLDPDAGLLGANVLGIGQPIYDSQIAAACLAVAGVAAVTSVAFTGAARPLRRIFFTEFIHRRPGGRRLRFPPPPAIESPRHDPGMGRYFVVPNDPAHVSLSGSPAQW